nr:glycosyltransferase [Desulfosporosinus acidiphilus]
MSTVSLCMIVKNEADCLPASLKSVQGLVNEMIVVDTGSNDRTPDIALAWGAKVIPFAWTGDFSAARNFSLENASSDWILVLDADEELQTVNVDSFFELLNNRQVEGYFLTIKSYLGPSLGESEDQAVRLFRNKPEYRFEGAIHEQVTPAILRRKGGTGLTSANLTVHHSGYLKDRLKLKNKFARNCEIIQNELLKDSGNPFLLYCLGLEYYQQNSIAAGLNHMTKALANMTGREGYFEDVLLNVALGYLQLSDVVSLRSFANKVLIMYPDHADFLFLRGTAHFLFRNHPAARLDLERCLQIGTLRLFTHEQAKSLLTNILQASMDSHPFAETSYEFPLPAKNNCIMYGDNYPKERQEQTAMKHRVLIASPVKQNEKILSEFLASLTQLKTTNLEVHFAFIDDQNDHQLLSQFAQDQPKVRIYPGNLNGDYLRDETTHHWREDLIWKVACYKDHFIKLALDEMFDYLFLVDSDLWLNPNTLVHLLSLNKDIVSEVFWTRWNPDLIPLPQVWIRDQYTLYSSGRDESLTEEETNLRTQDFMQMLSRPGTYKVGGLGACTLISRHALEQGVSFQEIYNLGLTGEDRHFCIRAAALGLELFADTHYPPFHIYRESELEKLQNYKETLAELQQVISLNEIPPLPSQQKLSQLNSHPQVHVEKGKITLAMLVRNESDRYLERVLKQATEYIDQAVILDDASVDNTVHLCRELLRGIPLTLHSNHKPMFHNEIFLRKQLWEMALSSNSEWIVILDADELFEENAPSHLRELLKYSQDVDYYSFRLYDLWTETHYRDDSLWQAHHWYRPFIVRNVQGFQAKWRETPQHCGRFPVNIIELRSAASPLRIKHLGWIRPQDRLAKYYRYKELDPEGTYGKLEQYQSILDPAPNLIPWEKVDFFPPYEKNHEQN